MKSFNVIQSIIESELKKERTYKSRKKTKSIKPSALGTPCLRKLYYSFNQVDEDFPFPLDAKKRMLVGNGLHYELTQKLDDSGYLVKYRDADGCIPKDENGREDPEFVLKDDNLYIKRAKVDAVVVKDGLLWLAEFKSINNRGFQSLRGAPKLAHYIQGITYLYIFNKMLKAGKFSHIKELKEFEKAEGICFFYVNKDQPKEAEFVYKSDDTMFKHIVNKIINIKEATDQKKLPEKTPDYCQSCPWRTKCSRDYNID